MGSVEMVGSVVEEDDETLPGSSRRKKSPNENDLIGSQMMVDGEAWGGGGEIVKNEEFSESQGLWLSFCIHVVLHTHFLSTYPSYTTHPEYARSPTETGHTRDGGISSACGE